MFKDWNRSNFQKVLPALALACVVACTTDDPEPSTFPPAPPAPVSEEVTGNTGARLLALEQRMLDVPTREQVREDLMFVVTLMTERIDSRIAQAERRILWSLLGLMAAVVGAVYEYRRRQSLSSGIFQRGSASSRRRTAS